jgi:hypothetical protein
MTRMNLNLCLKHGGSSTAGACEMCYPSRCLTHDQPLPCKTCLGKDVSVEDAVKQAKEQSLEERVASLEAAVSALQTALSAANTQVSALQQEVKVLRSL